jgi:hypothetical protein
MGNPTLKNVPSAKIGTSLRDVQDNIMRRSGNFPASNTYDAKLGAVKQNSPQYRVGTAKRIAMGGNKVVPGPDKYMLSSTLTGP